MTGSAPANGASEPETAPGFRGLLLVWFVNGCLLAPLSTQLPVYVESALHRPPLFTATLQTVQLGCGGVAAILGGVLADSLGTKRTLLVGLMGAAILSLQFHATLPIVMIAIAICYGATSGVQSVGGQAYLLAALRSRRLGMGSAAFFLGNTLGSSLGNLLVGRALDRWGFQTVTTIITVGSCTLVALTAFFLPSVKARASREAAGTLLLGYRHLLERGEIRLLCSLRYITTCFWGAVTLLMPLLVFRATGSKAAAGMYAAASLIVAATFQVAVGRLSDRIGRRGLTVALTGLIVCSALITGREVGNLTGLVAGGILGAASAWSLSTLMPGLIDDMSNLDEKGRLVGLMHAIWSGAMLSGSLIAGVLVSINPSSPLYVVGCANIASVAIAVVLSRRTGSAPPSWTASALSPRLL